MARKEHKYHYIYKITCLKNNRYYIGMHSTSNLEDGYLGGGKRIKNSIKKHGKEFHRKEILEFLDNRKLLINREIEIINQELLNDPLCINLSLGGSGGSIHHKWTNAEQKKFNKKSQLKMKFLWENDPNWARNFKDKLSIKLEERVKSGNFIRFDWTNRKHKEETKKRMSEKASLRTGNKNSQFGRIWIYNTELKENKKISKDSLEIFINSGWIKGRKM